MCEIRRIDTPQIHIQKDLHIMGSAAYCRRNSVSVDTLRLTREDRVPFTTPLDRIDSHTHSIGLLVMSVFLLCYYRKCHGSLCACCKRNVGISYVRVASRFGWQTVDFASR